MPKIRCVRVILTRPTTENLVLVKVETDEPGLHGWGCGTYTQRCTAVAEVVRTYLDPLLRGRDVARISELWRLMHHNGYWRHGPVVNNAVSGVDMALWDIKGRMAGMPVYELLGGRVREGAGVYQHAAGRGPEEVLDAVRVLLATGVRHVRVQIAESPHASADGLRPSSAGYGGRGTVGGRPRGALEGAYYHPGEYHREIVAAMEYVRDAVGDEVELLHDVHSRLTPVQAIALARDLEGCRLFFLEDALPPEGLDWYREMRSATVTPQAVGELFVHGAEWVPLVTGRLIDYLRLHLSAVGGLTPARAATALCEAHGVRTAWHGPKDTSPIGHAANLALDVSSYAFGIQEFAPFTDAERNIFSGLPVLEDGYLYPNEGSGWGMEVNEEAAAGYPIDTSEPIDWTQCRLPDGSLARP